MRPRTLRQAFGPFRGMRTSLPEAGTPPDFCHYAENMYPVDGGHGREWQQRGGFAYTTGLPTSVVKCFAQFDAADGASHVVAVMQSGIYTLAFTGGFPGYQWTLVVNAAVLSVAGITVDPVSPSYAIVFANRLVFSDGVNRPWTWDGTSGGGVQVLSACPVAYGPPVEYYGKLFVIKAADRRTIAWSEENDPTTGYEDAGFNNAWTISQSGDEPLTTLLGRNEGLYYWRAHSIGVIRGAVAADFSTTGVLDAISQTVGTIYPGGRVSNGADIWFLDGAQRVLVIPLGGEPVNVMPYQGSSFGSEPFGVGLQVPGPTAARADHRLAVVGPNKQMPVPQVWVGMNRADQNLAGIGAALVFDAVAHTAIGWYTAPTGPTVDAMALLTRVTDPQFGESTVLMGNAYVSGKQPMLQWLTGARYDSTAPGSVNVSNVTGVLIGPPAAASNDTESHLDRCDVLVPSPVGLAPTLSLKLLTSAANTNATMLSLGSSGSIGSPLTGTEERVVFGIDAIGHWFRPVFSFLNGSLSGYTLHLTVLSEAADVL